MVYEATWKEQPRYFVEELSASLKCPIHKGLLGKPVIASCGHTFCQPCILRCLDESEEAECPIDHCSLNESGCLIPNLALEGQINDLFVYCRYALTRNVNGFAVDPQVENASKSLFLWLTVIVGMSIEAKTLSGICT